MLYLVTGASGSGKTACLEILRQRNPQIVWYDFDEVGVPADADKVWRQRTTEYWLQRTIQNQAARLDTCINGNIILGEVLACPSAPEIHRLAVCLLDCSDVVRIDRLRARNSHGANMDMLCWANWQRMHAVDPQWYQNTIRDDAAPEMRWERWEDWQRGDPRWQTCVLDTTHLTIAEVAEAILQWINQESPGLGAGRAS